MFGIFAAGKEKNHIYWIKKTKKRMVVDVDRPYTNDVDCLGLDRLYTYKMLVRFVCFNFAERPDDKCPPYCLRTSELIIME